MLDLKSLFTFLKCVKTELDWLSGIVHKTTACGADTPYGCEFKSCLLHFRSSFLQMCLEKEWRMTQVFGHRHSCGRPGSNSCGHVGRDADERSVSPCLPSFTFQKVSKFTEKQNKTTTKTNPSNVGDTY